MNGNHHWEPRRPPVLGCILQSINFALDFAFSLALIPPVPTLEAFKRVHSGFPSLFHKV